LLRFHKKLNKNHPNDAVKRIKVKKRAASLTKFFAYIERISLNSIYKKNSISSSIEISYSENGKRFAIPVWIDEVTG
jgi:hypothetical protein